MNWIKNKYIRCEWNKIRKKIESDQIETTIESNQNENCESYRVKNGCQHKTTDAEDGASVGYLIQKWEGCWCSGAVFVVILIAAEMHGQVDVDIDIAYL